MKNPRVAVGISRVTGVLQETIGFLFAVMFGLCTIMIFVAARDLFESSVSGGIAVLVIFLCLTALGVWLIVCGRKNRVLAKKFSKYEEAIKQNPYGRISDIATAVGVSFDSAKKDLEAMIRKKFFPNVFIDWSTNSLSTRCEGPAANTNWRVETKSASTGAEMVMVKCPGCGGINSVPKGQRGECEYCGSVLKGE